jgi:hypothetical protein
VIGRERESRLLRELAASSEAEFVVVYGRRRVGKTYLIRQLFEGEFTFTYTGVANVSAQSQRESFLRALVEHGHAPAGPVRTWFDVFAELKAFLLAQRGGPRLVFLDELPWMDNKRSDFLPAFEHFWNGWASGAPRLTLIACGSATAWITKKIFRAKGGLYNRVTRQIKLQPFTLAECRELLEEKGIVWGATDIAECYMVFGGIPYYLRMLRRGLSLAQNVDEICFAPDAPLRNEFDRLFDTLFLDGSRHQEVVVALAKKRMGLTRDEIVRSVSFADGGNLTRVLRELEESGFIREYSPFGKAKKGALFQLADPFSGFHVNFMAGKSRQSWSAFVGKAAQRAWAGNAFEQLCLAHIAQIQMALGIKGVQQDICSWRDPTAQIDLVIDRDDNIINLCEMKFWNSLFEVDKSTDRALRERASAFVADTKTRKGVHLTLVTTYGLAPNRHSNLFQSVVTLEDLLRR